MTVHNTHDYSGVFREAVVRPPLPGLTVNFWIIFALLL